MAATALRRCHTLEIQTNLDEVTAVAEEYLCQANRKQRVKSASRTLERLGLIAIALATTSAIATPELMAIDTVQTHSEQSSGARTKPRSNSEIARS